MIGHHGVSSFTGLSFAKEGGMPCVTMRVLRNTMYRSRSESTLSLLNGGKIARMSFARQREADSKFEGTKQHIYSLPEESSLPE